MCWLKLIPRFRTAEVEAKVWVDADSSLREIDRSSNFLSWLSKPTGINLDSDGFRHMRLEVVGGITVDR